MKNKFAYIVDDNDAPNPPTCLETVVHVVLYLAIGLIIGALVFWLFGAL
jgi:hypothetical protein